MVAQQGKTDDGFDLAAWLGAASRPEREVVLYAANAVQAEIDRLEREKVDVEEAAAAEHGSGSWADDGDDAVSEEVAKQVDAIDRKLAAARKKLAASGVLFTVRSADSDEIDEINAANPMPKSPDDVTRNRVANARLMAQLAAQVVGPRAFTVDELTQLRHAVGEPEFLKLYTAAVDTMSEGAASSPLWRSTFGSSRS